MDTGNLAKWLDVPANPWPPDHFRILGLAPGEGTADDIESVVFERMERLRTYQLKYPEEVTEGMNRLAQAMVCLCDPAERKIYEQSLGLHRNEPPARPENLPTGKLVVPSRRIPREFPPPDEPAKLPVARQIQEILDTTRREPQELDEYSYPIPTEASDTGRRAIQKRVFLRRLSRHLHNFLTILNAPSKRKNAERDAKALQHTCKAINRMWASEYWAKLELEGQGERLLSITKILARYPSLDYLVANQIQDIHRDITQTLRRLQDERMASLMQSMAQRDMRRQKGKVFRKIRDTFRKPEKLWFDIVAVTVVITLVRWML